MIINDLFNNKKTAVAEGKADYNFDIEDLKRLEQIRDLATLKAQAFELISRPSARPMKPEKVEWFRNALDRMDSPLKIIKLMYDLLLSGEGQAVVGTRSSMNPNMYRKRFGEQVMAEQAPAINVPPGQQAITQPDGSTRISKIGSVSRAEYAKNMADYKVRNYTPAKQAEYARKMAPGGGGYTDGEKLANYQDQVKTFGSQGADPEMLNQISPAFRQGMKEDDDPYTVVSTKSDMYTKDVNGKTRQVYTNTATATDPKTGKFKKMVSTDVDGKTSSEYTDAEGNVHLDEKNYDESQNKVNESIDRLRHLAGI